MAAPAPPLLLASTSPYRAELMGRLGLAFDTRDPGVDETRRPGEAPRDYVLRLAREKAAAVHCRAPGSVVVGADQAAVLDGRILGKPGTEARAREQLRAASGRAVEFLTGLAVAGPEPGRIRAEVVPFRVAFRRLDAARIDAYVARDRPLDCAGSFRAEGLGIALFERLEGDDPAALVGLPLIRLVDLLAEAGVAVL